MLMHRRRDRTSPAQRAPAGRFLLRRVRLESSADEDGDGDGDLRAAAAVPYDAKLRMLRGREGAPLVDEGGDEGSGVRVRPERVRVGVAASRSSNKGVSSSGEVDGVDIGPPMSPSGGC